MGKSEEKNKISRIVPVKELNAEIHNLVNEIEVETEALENLSPDELEDRCIELGATSLDGYVYALEKIVRRLNEITE